MAKEVVESTHLQDRKAKLSALRKGNELSTTVFNTITEKEKDKILTEYLDIYEKAIEKVEQLEAEKQKLNIGKKSFEKDDKGEFTEKKIFDEQTIQQLQKVAGRLESIYTAIDKAMIVGDYEYWSALLKLIK